MTGDRDQDHPHGREMQKQQNGSEESLLIAVERRKAKSKELKKVKFLSRVRLWDPMDTRSSVHGIF